MEKNLLQGDGWEAHVYDFLDVFYEDPDEYVEKVAEEVPEVEDVGFLGFGSRDAVKNFLKGSVFSNDSEGWRKFEFSDYLGPIEEALSACEDVFTGRVHVFLFPTVNSFVVERMNGSTGYSQWQDTIILNLNPVEGWRDAMKASVVHELSHALRLREQHWNDVKDQLVMEGIAEHFREHFLGGVEAEWVKSISREEAEELFGDVLEHIGSQDEDVHKEVFYGTGDYPLWTGYAIGYYIVEDWLDSLDEVAWKDVLKKPAHEIIMESPFTSPFAAR